MESRTVSFGSFLTRSQNRIQPEPDLIYKQVTVRLWGKGLALRGTTPGARIAASKQVQVREGQFLLSRIDARHGAFGLVPPELDGALVSTDFPAFDIDCDEVNPRYLAWFSKTRGFVDLCRRASEGSTNRVRLKEDKLLKMEIVLPHPDDQRRIVARLDRVAALAEEAKRLQEEAERDTTTLTQSLHTALAPDGMHPFGDFVEPWEDREAIQPEGSYPQVGIKGFAGGLFRKEPIRGSSTSYRTFNRLHEGLLVVSQPKGWEGAVAMCDQHTAGWFVSPEYRTFRCRKDRLMPRYLGMLIRTPWFQAQLGQLTRGQGARRERLRPEMLLAMKTRMPRMDAQAAALEIVDRCRTASFQRLTATRDLGDLVPAMLHQVFAGEAECSAG